MTAQVTLPRAGPGAGAFRGYGDAALATALADAFARPPPRPVARAAPQAPAAAASVEDALLDALLLETLDVLPFSRAQIVRPGA